MEELIMTTASFALGVITGVIGLLTIACRSARKSKNNATVPIIKKTKTELTGCLSCGEKGRKKEGIFVYECQNCSDKSFWV